MCSDIINVNISKFIITALASMKVNAFYVQRMFVMNKTPKNLSSCCLSFLFMVLLFSIVTVVT